MISPAVSILRRGGLVAFPTETVYGLGADATNANAVKRIFAAKGRPVTNPLIVHVATAAIAQRYVAAWPDMADRLAQQFWPGPLTLVLRKNDRIVNEVSAGGTTVGLRVPDHPIALELLTAFDGPIAAPSANRSNHISPTDAAHVRAEFGDTVDLILDGGPCTVGIESTVLDLTTNPPRILRPGGVSRMQLHAVVGDVDSFSGHIEATSIAASPGQHERHYSPQTPAFRFQTEQWPKVINHAARSRIAIVAINIDGRTAGVRMCKMPDDPVAYARVLYRTLRDLDEQAFAAIYVEWPTGNAQWDALRDRIQRATKPAKFS